MIRRIAAMIKELFVATQAAVISSKIRQDSECRRAQVYPLCPHLYIIYIYIPYMRTILYRYIQTGRPPVPISSELKLKTNS